MGMLQQGVKSEGEVKSIVKSVERCNDGGQRPSAPPLKVKHGGGKMGKLKK